MKFVIRYFFRTVRLLLTPIVLFVDWLTTPKAIPRTEEEQQQLATESGKMALYQFRACPFCIKVRREMKRLGLSVEIRDAQKDASHRTALLIGGGEIKVPCLRIHDDKGEEQWMYESSDIIQYLREKFLTDELAKS